MNLTLGKRVKNMNNITSQKPAKEVGTDVDF